MLGQRSAKVILFTTADHDEFFRNIAVCVQQSPVSGKYAQTALVEGEEIRVGIIAVIGQNIAGAIALQHGFIDAAQIIADVRTVRAKFKAFIPALPAWVYVQVSEGEDPSAGDGLDMLCNSFTVSVFSSAEGKNRKFIRVHIRRD